MTTATPAGPTLPLSVAGEAESLRVTRVKGPAATQHHLADLGFVEGTEVHVVSRAGGDVIVLVKGSRFALNRSMSHHIMVTPIEAATEVAAESSASASALAPSAESARPRKKSLLTAS